MNNITQVFIFCAGRGERMMPLTQSTPKPLLKVQNKSILGHILDKVQKISSVQKILINAFYLADEIVDFVKSVNDPRIIISRESEKIETGGGLFFALDKIDVNQPLLTLNGDVLWHDKAEISDMEYLFSKFNSTKHDFLLGLKKTSEFYGYDGCGDFDLIENELLVRDFSSQSLQIERSFVYVGMQILNPQILASAKTLNQFSKCFSVSQFYKNSVGKNFILNRINGIELSGKYFHVGTPENLELANQEF